MTSTGAILEMARLLQTRQEVINSLLLITVYSATPFCFHLRLTSALMDTLRMMHWCAVLTSAARGIKERPPPSKVGPVSRLD